MVAAILTLIGSLGGVIVGQWLAGRNLDRQLDHDREVRREERAHELELDRDRRRDDHRARLHLERLVAYKAFAASHRARRRADEEYRMWVAHRSFRATQSPPDLRDIEAVEEKVTQTGEHSSQLRREMEDAVVVVEVVASGAVRVAARDVQAAAFELGRIELSDAFRFTGQAGGPDEAAPWLDARQALADAEERLLGAICAELELDR